MADVTASIVEQEVVATVGATEISATLVNDGAVNIVTELEVGPAGPPGPARTITIPSPRANDSFTLFYTQEPTTINEIRALVRGSGSSATFEIRYAADRSATGTLASVSAAVSNTTTGQVIATQNMPIPAGQFIWVAVTAVPVQPDELSVSVSF